MFNASLLALVIVVAMVAGVVVGFIYGQKNRFLDFSKEIGDRLIDICDPSLNINGKNNDISFLDGEDDLFSDLFFKNIIRIGNISAGIDDREFVPVPKSFAVMPIAGNPA